MRAASISTRQCVKALRKANFAIVRNAGDHLILKNADGTRTLSIPQRQTLRTGLVRLLIKQAGLSVTEFEELRKGK